ncbi:MAG: hypothetical protein RLY20_1044 [Verrucomicrobiota bacterium]
MANKEYRPEISPLSFVGAEALSVVRRGDELSGGKYLGVPTVAELVQSNGQQTAVVGSKPVALLHDRRERSSSANPVWFATGALPETLLPVLTNRLGSFPVAASPNTGRDQWAVRCLTEEFWANVVPRYSVLWLSEPDASQHQHGPGSPEALAAIKGSDARLATLLRELDRRGIRAETDIVVVSDHGFSTIGENESVTKELLGMGLNAQSVWKVPPQNGDVVVVGNGGSVLLYIVGRPPLVVERVVRALQQRKPSGVIFTRDGLPGTFPLSAAMLNSSTAPDVLVASAWKMSVLSSTHPQVAIFNDGYNDYQPGSGMHVTLSPTDLHNTAVASGPDFRSGLVSTLASGNVDVAPTLLWLMGITPPQPLDGRVLSESLVDAKLPLAGEKPGCLEAKRDLSGGHWQQRLKYTEVNGVRYLDEGNGSWQPLRGTNFPSARTGN